MMTLILLALASFMVWMAIQPLLPFAVPDRLAPFVVAGVAAGMYYLPWHRWLVILAASGGVLLLHRAVAMTGIVMPAPWRTRDIPRPHLPRRNQVITLGEQSFTPGKEPTRVGNRIPKL
jgi:hypothetical protein